MIFEWKSGIYAQNQNYYGMGVNLNWLSAEFVSRLLTLKIITCQYRNVKIVTS